MPTVDQWTPNAVESEAAAGLIADIRCWFDHQSVRARTQRIRDLVVSIRQQLLTYGPALAVPGRVNLGSLMIAAMTDADLHSLELFANTHIGASDGSILLAERPGLLHDLRQAEMRLAQLADDLATKMEPA